MTPSGKTNRQQLRAIAESAWQEYRHLPEKTATEEEILTDVEKLLQQIWMARSIRENSSTARGGLQCLNHVH